LDDVYCIMTKSLREFTRFIWWMCGSSGSSDQAKRPALWVRLYTAFVYIRTWLYILWSLISEDTFVQ